MIPKSGNRFSVRSCGDKNDRKPDSPIAKKYVPSPNHDARKSRDRHSAAALHRHADGRGGAGAAQATARRRSRRTTSSMRTAASLRWCRKRGAPGMAAPDRGRARSTSIRARSASRSSIPATSSAIAIFPTRRSTPSSRSAATSSRAAAFARERVLGHSDVAPARKKDPGEKFPWAKLAAAGVGFWVEPAPIVEGRTLSANDRGAAVEDLQKQLIRFGYGLEISRLYDDDTRRSSPRSSAISGPSASTGSPILDHARRCARLLTTLRAHH